MEEKDLKQIKDVFKEELKPFATKEDVKSGVSAGLTEFWEGNLEPAFDALNDRLDVVQTKLDKALYREFQGKEAKVIEVKI